jgi:hypothetical protein
MAASEALVLFACCIGGGTSSRRLAFTACRYLEKACVIIMRVFKLLAASFSLLILRRPSLRLDEASQGEGGG